MKSKSFDQIEMISGNNILTGNELFDKWFSKDGGIVPGSKIFVTGNSGAGKTTLMINIMNWLKNHKSSFYSREMSISSLKQQVKDYKFNNTNAFFIDDEDCPSLEEYIIELDKIKPDFVIIDSLQAIATSDYPDFSEEKGSIIVREIITKWCKENNSTLFIIGHNTKDNEFAGKNTNMQMVDAHMVLEYDKKSNTRKIFWGKKNRKGPMGELFYSIDNGEIIFSDIDPSQIQENISFYAEFEIFIQTLFKKINVDEQKKKEIKKEINKKSTEFYNKFNGEQYQYMISFMPEIYKIFSKHGY